MENGLCMTCLSQKGCVLTSRLPVSQCEEFNTEKLNLSATKVKLFNRSARERSCLVSPEETNAE